MDVLIALRGLSYQFGEAASKFNVKNLFDAASFDAFIIRQRIKLKVLVSPIHLFSTSTLHKSGVGVGPDVYRAKALSARMARNTPPNDHPKSCAARLSPIRNNEQTEQTFIARYTIW